MQTKMNSNKNTGAEVKILKLSEIEFSYNKKYISQQ